MRSAILNIWAGAGSLLDLFSHCRAKRPKLKSARIRIYEYENLPPGYTHPDSDKINMQQDLLAVGSDFSRAIERTDDEKFY